MYIYIPPYIYTSIFLSIYISTHLHIYVIWLDSSKKRKTRNHQSKLHYRRCEKVTLQVLRESYTTGAARKLHYRCCEKVTLQVLRESYTTGVARKQLMINRYSSNFHMLIVSFFSLLLVFLHVANNYTWRFSNFTHN